MVVPRLLRRGPARLLPRGARILRFRVPLGGRTPDRLGGRGRPPARAGLRRVLGSVLRPGHEHAFKTDFGRVLHGTLYPGEAAGERAVVLLGALAAPQRYLRHVARDLAAAGYGVLTFDYRGIGASRLSGDPRTNLDDWGEDVRAALAEARALFSPRRLLALGHSLGGMLLGHSGAGECVDGALLVGATHARPAHYGGVARLKVEAAYRILPPLARALGELPGWAGLRTPVPRDAIVQWSRWGKRGRFERWNGASSEGAFASLRGPLLGVAVSDDADAPVAAVDALLGKFRRAGVRRERLEPRPGERIGHFGLFRADAPVWLRRRLRAWLAELAES
ncbi:MAG: alpha/beta fold hydrolase [Planctomycetota bacterium]|nr:MAG: alpha/beta fold hydrolase [Planctomycetota bacterium]